VPQGAGPPAPNRRARTEGSVSTAVITIGGYGTGTIQSGWQYTLFHYGTFSGGDPSLTPELPWFVATDTGGTFIVKAS
jgi:hypothetical protein